MAAVTIIIPTYKPKEYLQDCIKSIANQDFIDYELLIILNGCNEPYYSEIINLIGKHNLETQTRLLQTDQPGVSNARNIGLDNATGNYIAFIDDDDSISSNYLSGLLSVATPNSVAVSNVARIDDKKIDANYKISKSYEYLWTNGFKNIFKSRRVLNSPWMKLYPRNLIADIRFDTQFSLGEDALFNFKVSRNIDNLVATSPSSIYYYNNRVGSSWTNNSKRKLFSHFKGLLCKYTSIYLSAPNKYNLFFYMSRLMAVTISFIPLILKKTFQIR